MGFVVAATVIITYVILITKSIYIAKTAKDNLGSYIAIGIAGILLFHFTENIGMTMGLLPITGVPLPFVSYGGSSLLYKLNDDWIAFKHKRKKTESNICRLK